MTKKTAWLSNEEYHRIFSQTPRICVDLVIMVGGKLLLTKRKIAPYKGTWHFPGGRILMGEAIAEARLRVFKKELGLKKIAVKKMKLLGAMEFPRDGGYHSISVAFLVKLSEKQFKQIRIDEQACGIKLVDIKNLPSRMHPIHRKFLQSLSL